MENKVRLLSLKAELNWNILVQIFSKEQLLGQVVLFQPLLEFDP